MNTAVQSHLILIGLKHNSKYQTDLPAALMERHLPTLFSKIQRLVKHQLQRQFESIPALRSKQIQQPLCDETICFQAKIN